MKTVMFKCRACGRYTFENKCPKCGEETTTPIPARFSPEDHYGKYRRRLLREETG